MNEFNNIKVGILIPTFNRKIYLEKAVKSVCEQTYGNIEIIVIDNGSTDGTAEFMASRSDKRVRYVANENNIGMVGSINKGINLFSDEVEWCTILSDDDMLDASYIASMIQFKCANSVKFIAHSHRIFIDADGRKIRDARPAPLVESAFGYVFSRTRQERETSLTGVFFSRRAFEIIGEYPRFSTGMATDDAFIFALSIKDNLYFNGDAVVFVRAHEHAESLRASDTIKHFQALEEYAEYVRKVVGQSEGYGREKKTTLEKALRKYIMQLNGVLLLRSVHALHGKRDKDAAFQLSQLYAVIANKHYRFSFYIQIRIFIVKYFNISPESSKLYRLLFKLRTAIKWTR